MSQMMVASDLAGHESHGLWRLPQYVSQIEAGVVDPRAVPRIELDRGALVHLHGANGFGHIVLSAARDTAVERARIYGVGAVAVRRSGYAGRLADICQNASTDNAVVLVFANDAGSGQAVAPHGGRDARLSTNPIAAGVPRPGDPLVVDLATSVVASGRLSVDQERLVSTPPDWTTDTGALRPAGGAKGFALALVVEALAGGLTRAGTVREQPAHDDQGALVIAFDLGTPGQSDAFKADVDGYLEWVRTSRPTVDSQAVLLPGERSADLTEKRRKHGLPVQRSTFSAVQTVCQAAGVEPPRT